MIERREFISICRQIGAMMEVGVDFLRITQALRAQTDNARLLELYDQLDADLKEGDSLSEAMSHAPDVFSPFAVSLVQQGERRGNIESAWERVADFFQQQAREDLEIGEDAAPLEPAGAAFGNSSGVGGGKISLASGRIGAVAPDFWEHAQSVAARFFVGAAGFLIVLGVARALVELSVVEARWAASFQLATAALFLGIAGALMLRGLAKRPVEAVRCAFCGRAGSKDLHLSRSKRVADAAICSECAAGIALGAPTTEAHDAAREEERVERMKALRDVADALPEQSGATEALTGDDADDDLIVLDDDDPLAPPLAR